MKEKSIKFQKVVAEIIYLFLISFFCYTALNKFLNINSFRINMIKTSIFDKDVVFYLSYFVIFIEFLVVLILLINKIKGLIMFSFLMLVFTLYISYLNFKGLYEVCGCGGILNGLDYNYHLIINITLIFSSIYCLLISNIKFNEK